LSVALEEGGCSEEEGAEGKEIGVSSIFFSFSFSGDRDCRENLGVEGSGCRGKRGGVWEIICRLFKIEN
jgi:hypothetical protein